MSPKKPPHTEFAKRLFLAQRRQELRTGVELDRSLFAHKVGLSEATVSMWFTGKQLPNVKQMDAIAKVLGVSPGWLAFGEQTVFTTPDGESRGGSEPPPPDDHQRDQRGRK